MGQDRVLVVDDDPGIRSLVAEVFRERGAEVEIAADGGEAIAALRRNPGRFTLIVTDIQMPGINGLELLDYVMAERIAVPAIVLSSWAGDAGGTGEVLARGAVAVVAKPFLVPDLLEQADAARARAAQPPAPAPSDRLREQPPARP